MQPNPDIQRVYLSKLKECQNSKTKFVDADFPPEKTSLLKGNWDDIDIEIEDCKEEW